MGIIPEHENLLAKREQERKLKNDAYMNSLTKTGKLKSDKGKSSLNATSESKRPESTSTNKRPESSSNSNNKRPDSTTTTKTNSKPNTPMNKSLNNSINNNTLSRPNSTPTPGPTISFTGTKSQIAAKEFMIQNFPKFAVYHGEEEQTKTMSSETSGAVSNNKNNQKNNYNSSYSNNNNHNHHDRSSNNLPPEKWESVLHRQQNNECNAIMDTFHKKHIISPKPEVLMKALVVPQDLPEVLIIDQFADIQISDRLMENPLPPEYLRINRMPKPKKTKSKKKKSSSAA